MKKIQVMFLVCCLLMPVFAARAENDLLPKLSGDYKGQKVERLIKSDVVQLVNGKKVRMIGLKGFEAPKKYNLPRDEYGFVIEDTSDDPTVPIEERACSFAEELLLNQKVDVELGVKAVDDDGYLLGYLFLKDGRMANAEILRQGYAELHIQPPNLKYAEQLREAYREARAEKRGIHIE